MIDNNNININNDFTSYITNNYNIGIDNDKIEQACKGLAYCIEHKIPILLMGNGGSAYTAAHFAQDITKVLSGNAHSLSDNYGLVMAVANDLSYDDVFEFQLQRFINNNPNQKPLIIALSYSGESPNILYAVSLARTNKFPVLSITGNNGGDLIKISNLNINVPTTNIYVAESVHSIILHYFIDYLKVYFNSRWDELE